MVVEHLFPRSKSMKKVLGVTISITATILAISLPVVGLASPSFPTLSANSNEEAPIAQEDSKTQEQNKKIHEFHFKLRLILPFSTIKFGTDYYAGYQDPPVPAYGGGATIALELNNAFAFETGFDRSTFVGYEDYTSVYVRSGYVPALLDRRENHKGWVLQVGALGGMRYFGTTTDHEMEKGSEHILYFLVAGTVEAIRYWRKHFGMCVRLLVNVEIGMALKREGTHATPNAAWSSDVDDRFGFGFGLDFGFVF